MKISKVITEQEKNDLKPFLPNVNLEKEFNRIEWEELVDNVQDLAIDLLQSDASDASHFDNLANKISGFEY